MQRRWHKQMGAVLAACLLLLCAAGCGAKTPDAGSIADKVYGQAGHTYKMQWELNEQAKTMQGTLYLTYRNPTGQALAEVPLMVYPNAYSSEQTAPFAATSMQAAYPNGFSAGGMEIQTLKVEGQSAVYALRNEDKTLMLVQLPHALEKDAAVEIEIGFTVQIPNSLGRFGYGEKSFNLCNCYPIACAWDGEKFLTYPYEKQGDPFVSDVADYQVQLTVPRGMQAAFSGEGTRQETGDKAVYTIAARGMRDFAAVCSRSFSIEERTVTTKQGNEVTVRSFYYADQSQAMGKMAAQYGAQAVVAFSDMIGMYPYAQLDVVQTDFFIGGMEYPGMVLIDKSLYDPMIESELERIVVHEAGHQWFYAVVGSDQVKEPWVDEALTDYSTMLYFGYTYGLEREESYYKTDVLGTYLLAEQILPMKDGHKGVGQPSTAFEDELMYSVIVYTRGTMMLRAAEKQIGREQMLQVLSTYYARHAGGRATGEDVRKALEEQTGNDWNEFFTKWL